MQSDLTDAVDDLWKTMDGVYVGRLCPVHLGHEKIMDEMVGNHGIERSLLMLGGANETLSYRHLFNYSERKGLVLKLPKYEGLTVLPLPDMPTDPEWLEVLDDMLKSAKIDPMRAVFYGGCEEDIDFFIKAKRRTKIVNRFDGSSPKVSATEVRDALVHDRTLDGLVNPLLHRPLRELFAQNWEKLKKM
ncbi:MAG: hypothetical protein HY226_06845 [Candidatus Vogelbacteria bacterium]|nr:hypothetical protein [Candidatus Vogelbacteria bacterium]